MGIQMMGSQSNAQQSHIQACQLSRQNSWYSLTLNEVENQLENLGKPLGSMNLDELLKSVWSSEANQSIGMDIENTSASSLQRQASLTLARALSGKTVDQVWNEILEGQKKRLCQEIKSQEREPILGELTLEDFLVQAGLFAESSVSLSMELVTVDSASPQSFQQKMALSSSPSTGTISDTNPSVRKRNALDAPEKSIERRLRRKIKNRESAARSRARKQAYHNELVNKVSRLEEENVKLKKEKEFENTLPCAPLTEVKYQLRRTNSASF
ncbi:ABSCISIC ACID-INSENSITIVE 5-like protein 2 [Mercurialis annua]|uniref:ABSCISIC ACID-INSENSITIVE 5-like protein 2 n=1 Tax=Mercurialis annua TaxID=3986 RepID=UPI00215F2A4E|nr:ABSCISIC ACID-INSENSITIVE 5-like protein 2 [Mercurialis annua]XP_050239002.1 ABSCISIC ACID-INSENSITIVE 5-like protein 2 [Mercurialis annua]XP_050239003.1 ABSCISIC ACID-INSENSITIVE 5-like protein 2 [Mercurialis annua]XP_050239004.1 ABSCISIC ACID-INSENSITIVE 5-like protein 2 [Mercurialis annua]